jgi:serine phosphatase RsbU (regulator of sigma subunit)/CHASE3 domain sensor protein
VTLSALGNLTLRVRVSLLLAGLTAVLAVVGVVCTVAVSRTRNVDTELRDRLQPASYSTQQLYIDYINQLAAVRGYDIAHTDLFYATYTAATKAATTDLQAVQRALSDAKSRADLATVVSLHQSWVDASATPQIALVKAGQFEQAQAGVTSGAGLGAFGKVRTAVTALNKDLTDRAAAAGDRSSHATHEVFWALGIGAAALLIGIIVAGGLLRRWVLVPTAALQYQLRLVADGGYDDQISGSGPPELAAVAADAELMRERIVTELERSRQAIEALYQSGPVVTGLREELAATPSLSLPGLALHGVLSAAEGILAGDWYDAVLLAGGRTAVLIADVSGHGAAAGLVALRVKLALTSALSLGLGPAAALAHATGMFAGEEERFASCVIMVIDPEGEAVTWSNAGHPPPLLYTPGGGAQHVELEPTGPLLSFFAGDWTERTIPFLPGQLLLGYTDGLGEARDVEGRQFETEGILEALDSLPDANPVAAVVACMAAVRNHAVDLRRDDVTIVAVAHER